MVILYLYSLVLQLQNKLRSVLVMNDQLFNLKRMFPSLTKPLHAIISLRANINLMQLIRRYWICVKCQTFILRGSLKSYSGTIPLFSFLHGKDLLQKQ